MGLGDGPGLSRSCGLFLLDFVPIVILTSGSRTSALADFSPIAASPHEPALGTVLLLLALNLLNYIDRYILPGAQPLVQKEFHATDQQMGALTTALFFFYMFARRSSGWLGDRFRRKPLIITGAVLWSLATLGTALCTAIGASISGARWSAWARPPSASMLLRCLSDFYPERERNRILSIFYLAIPVGAALGYLAGGELGSLWGWREPFLLCAIPGLIVAALYGGFGPRAGARRHGIDEIRPTLPDRSTFLAALLQRNRRVLDGARFGLASDHLCAGRHLGLGAHVSAPRQRPLRGERQPGGERYYSQLTELAAPLWAVGLRSAGSAPTIARSTWSRSGASC